MQNTSSKKSIIIIIIVLVLAALAYFYFSGNPSNSSTSSLSSVSTDSGQQGTGIAGTDVLVLLGQINSIHIDDTFFKSPVYNSLVDHTVVVPEQNVGRPNPFVPVPGAFVIPAPPGKTSATKH